MGEPIRMMEPRDAGAVIALCRAEGWDTTAEDVADLLACPACGVVAEQAGVPIGVATAFVYGSFGWVRNVIVAGDFRGRGVGTRLVEALVQELRRVAGLGALILEARSGPESLYRRLGFLPLGHTVRYRRELIAVCWGCCCPDWRRVTMRSARPLVVRLPARPSPGGVYGWPRPPRPIPR